MQAEANNRAASANPGPPWYPLPASFPDTAARHPNAVLLQTAKPDGPADQSLLFLHPLAELVAWCPDEIDALLSAAKTHLAQGRYVAGTIAYEAGEHFIDIATDPTEQRAEPLARLAVFAAPITFNHRTALITGEASELHADSPNPPRNASLAPLGLAITPEVYADRIARIHAYLAAGHTYQVNFTDFITGTTTGTPLALYNSLLQAQPVAFAAFLNRPAGPILSLSPELFFRCTAGRIAVRPMKGTWPRGLNEAEDRIAADSLRTDSKNRSEHVTIVDLLRNDLGRVCQLGSVHVDALFQVERYNTLFQMTSSISGTLRPNLSAVDALRDLFPCGSITGAPKRRTMQIIRELERGPRGIYTGAIGFFAPNGDACFNVAIRTLTLHGNTFALGVGGGITADSDAADEYRECALKGSFLTRRPTTFSLFETMRAERSIVPLLPCHLARLGSSAAYFAIPFHSDRLQHEVELAANTGGPRPHRIRVELSPQGTWKIEATPLQDLPWAGRLLLSTERANSHDVQLHHKTTGRAFYNQHLAAAQQAGFDEVLFRNELGHITEGAITNIFARFGDRWLTPPLQSGVLPGVQRSLLLRDLPGTSEAVLTPHDLSQADEIILCNALRGTRPVHQIEDASATILWTRPGA